jgi:hypothetical protein
VRLIFPRLGEHSGRGEGPERGGLGLAGPGARVEVDRAIKDGESPKGGVRRDAGGAVQCNRSIFGVDHRGELPTVALVPFGVVPDREVIRYMEGPGGEGGHREEGSGKYNRLRCVSRAGSIIYGSSGR